MSLDKITLMLIRGDDSDTIESAATTQFGMTLDQVKAAIIDARQQITIAANFNRVDEIGKAYLRLNDIYASSIEDNPKTALDAQKELNKLLRLYELQKSPGAESDDEAGGTLDAQELQAIAAHLIPLALAPQDYPLKEHARIAADRIRQLGGA